MRPLTVGEAIGRIKEGAPGFVTIPALTGKVAFASEFKAQKGEYGAGKTEQSVLLVDDSTGDKFYLTNRNERFDFAQMKGATVILARPRHKREKPIPANAEPIKGNLREGNDGKQYLNVYLNGYGEVWESNGDKAYADREAEFDFDGFTTGGPSARTAQKAAPQTSNASAPQFTPTAPPRSPEEILSEFQDNFSTGLNEAASSVESLVNDVVEVGRSHFQDEVALATFTGLVVGSALKTGQSIAASLFIESNKQRFARRF
jgi:hypothetical protein